MTLLAAEEVNGILNHVALAALLLLDCGHRHCRPRCLQAVSNFCLTNTSVSLSDGVSVRLQWSQRSK